VQAWVDNPTKNFGIIIQDYTGAADNLVFRSGEASTPAIGPC
jgi:hypothetical protein